MSKFMKVAGLALALLVLPSVAQAQLQLGARLGYAIPGGSIDKGESMKDYSSSQVPIEIDAGWRFNQFSLGVYYAYSPGTTGNTIKGLCAGASCSTSGQNYGLSGSWNFAPKAGMQPWLGLRLGMETFEIKISAGGLSSTVKTDAFSFGLQGGLDFALGPITLGPYLSYDTSEFTKIKMTGSPDQSIPSDQQAYHSWFSLGAKLGVTF